MYQLSSFKKTVVAFNSLLILLATATSMATDCYTELSPSSSLYTNELLYNARSIGTQLHLLPSDADVYIAKSNIGIGLDRNPFAVKLTLFGAYALFDISAEGNWSKSIEYTSLEILKGIRGCMLLGNLYGSSLHLKLGYDFPPFGRHVSEIMMPYNTVTRSILHEQMLLMGAGVNHITPLHQWHSSISYCVNTNDQGFVYLVNGQYRTAKTRQFGPLAIDFLLGGGVAYLQSKPATKWLKNVYSQLTLQKIYDIRAEYTYDASFAQSINRFDKLWVDELTCHVPDTLSIEFSRRLFESVMLKHASRLMLVAGYEHGSRQAEIVNNVFGALKLELFKKRITLISGVHLQRKYFENALAWISRAAILL